MKFDDIKKALDLLYNVEELEDSLENLSDEELNELYSHPLLKNYDLLP